MPYRRRTYRRRRRPVRLRYGQGAMRRMQIGTQIRSRFYRGMGGRVAMVHKHVRSALLLGMGGVVSNALIQTSTGVGGGYAGVGQAFRLSYLPNVNEFTALYDQYMITRIKITVRWSSTNISMIETANAVGNISAPYVLWVVDRDDAAAPASSLAGANDLREYQSMKRYQFDTGRRTLSFSFIPNILTQNWETSVATAYTTSYRKWIDAGDPDTEHFGLKLLFITPNDGTSSVAVRNYFELEAKYYVSFRQPR